MYIELDIFVIYMAKNRGEHVFGNFQTARRKRFPFLFHRSVKHYKQTRGNGWNPTPMHCI